MTASRPSSGAEHAAARVMKKRLMLRPSVNIWLCGAILGTAGVWPAYSQSAFSPLAGAWSGDGVVVLRTGSQERVRCKAGYLVKPSDTRQVKLELRCASDAYKFELSATWFSTKIRFLEIGSKARIALVEK